MAKDGKKKKKGGLPGRFAGRSQQAAPAENPFEQLYSRKKFDILGKRQKGVKKNAVQARTQANERRKNTLLVEYQQMHKANNFVDRRFGENDEHLTAEEKAVLRFQKQRMQDAAADRFALPEDDAEQDGEGLTHMGRSLSEFDDLPGSMFERDDEADDALDAEMTDRLHFGGGFVRKVPSDDAANAAAEPERHKTKKEVMSEIIAKSKAGKAEKQMQREEDLAATEALDETFRELLQGPALGAFMRPKGQKLDPKAIKQGEEEASFDRMRRELTFESRGTVGDRTRTAEELADLERQRLEALERQRLKRMRAGGDSGGESASDDDDLAKPSGGFALRRYKATHEDKDVTLRSDHQGGGDDLDDDFAAGSGEDEEGADGSGSDEEGDGALQRRQAQRAAGDHDLQLRLRQTTAALLKKHGVQPSDQSAAELEAAEVGSSEGEEGSEEAGSGSEGQDASANSEDNATEDVEQSEEETEQQQLPVAHASAPPISRPARPKAQLEGPLDVSFTPSVPDTYPQFAAMVAGRPASEVALVVSRIRGANAATLASDSRRGLQVLYGFLVQYFVDLAAQRPPAMAHLDALTPILVSATAEVPYFATTVARARLQRAQQRLASALQDPGPGNNYGWPSSSVVLQLQLWATLFPLSDKRHPVATPAALLTNAYLAMCPVVRARHAAVGLLLASMAVRAAAAGGRWAPEAVNFVTDILTDTARGDEDSVLQFSRSSASAGSRKHKTAAAGAQPLDLSRVLSLPDDDPHFSTAEFAASVLMAVLQLLGRMASATGSVPSFPELFQPAVDALVSLSAVSPTLHQDVEAQRQSILADLQQRSAAAISARRPLVRKSDKAAAVKLYNPRFEEDYVAGKDYDPDRERAAAKRLKRAVQKERRGAMRELRKDAAFIDTEREKEKMATKTAHRKTRRANFAWMEMLESDLKSGGQGGMWKKRKPR